MSAPETSIIEIPFHSPPVRVRLLATLGLVEIGPEDVCPNNRLGDFQQQYPGLFPKNPQDEFYWKPEQWKKLPGIEYKTWYGRTVVLPLKNSSPGKEE